MRFDFSGKTIVVTGGSAGIGLAIAEQFAGLGGQIAICGRSEEKLKLAKDQLAGQGYNVFSKSVNVANGEEMFAFADDVEKEFGRLDIWVNNAAICPYHKIIDTPEDVWDDTLNINLKSIYLSARIARQKMSQRGGSIINAASFATIMPSVGSGLYAATKSAVTSMTKSLAAELAPLFIRVNGYIPGVIKTDMTAPAIAKNGDFMREVIAMNDFGEPGDVANAVVFLASKYASYITGSFIEVSGGKFCVQNPTLTWDELED